MSALRVLLVDGNRDFLHGASEWLVAGARAELVGTASTGRQAIDEAKRLAPDVVLMDESMPDMKTVDVIRGIKSAVEPPHVILLTFHGGETARQAAAATGADDAVAKSRITELQLSVLGEFLRDRRPRLASTRLRTTTHVPSGDRNTRSEP